jgi:hypothetical protein
MAERKAGQLMAVIERNQTVGLKQGNSPSGLGYCFEIVGGECACTLPPTT